MVIGSFQCSFRRAGFLRELRISPGIEITGLKNPTLLGRQGGHRRMQGRQNSVSLEIIR